ncbi:winged helix-turn-helix domain-containing protein [Endozoicomonas sp. SESOKO1]|uniref:winged helix-turn-helix domain-containing protein n=1 Tax=Endozoicomonas sp. SESOKO1 TaxID=2828742 RepID=UPI002148BC25|nr:winged helix-turn-helix domain-containing protein [Endozoicomonas sp. SESOKO1]
MPMRLLLVEDSRDVAGILFDYFEALVRRAQPGRQSQKLHCGELVLDMTTHEAFRAGQKIPLNPTGFRILSVLAAKAPATVTREEISYTLWQDNPPDGDILRNHIYQLRNQVDKPFKKAMIVTVPKVGYRLDSHE